MDPCVELARLTITHFVTHGHPPKEVPEAIRSALQGQRAATFVSLHGSDGALRGCKGTLQPWHASLMEEIISNAISACARDPRFTAVREEELPDLAIHVDVLSPMEPIQSIFELDVKRYGVLVSTPDGRRGVLLPDLESITTPEEQVDIACRKAGINPKLEAFRMERFTTVRHGGA